MIPMTDMTPCDAFRKPTGHILTKKTSFGGYNVVGISVHVLK